MNFDTNCLHAGYRPGIDGLQVGDAGKAALVLQHGPVAAGVVCARNGWIGLGAVIPGEQASGDQTSAPPAWVQQILANGGVWDSEQPPVGSEEQWVDRSWSRHSW